MRSTSFARISKPRASTSTSWTSPSAKNDWRLDEYFASHTPMLVGITLRNAGTVQPQDQRVFLPDHLGVIEAVRGLTRAPIVLGGAGFSSMPYAALEYFKTPFGVKGPGEFDSLRFGGRHRVGPLARDGVGTPHLGWPDRPCRSRGRASHRRRDARRPPHHGLPAALRASEQSRQPGLLRPRRPRQFADEERLPVRVQPLRRA